MIASRGSRRNNNIMTLTAAAAPASIGQITESSTLFPRNGFHLEPRCRVCRNDDMRKKVNDLLASGASYVFIVRSLAEANARLDERDWVTIDSVRNHCARHFPVQQVARSTYREILERRAQENGIDFINGVTTALTPIAYFETVMLKAFESLIDPGTTVDVGTGMIAAAKLQALLDSRSGQPDLAELRRKVNQIGEAVRTTVPKEMWATILAKLDDAQRLSEDIDDEQSGHPDEACEPDDYDDDF
jgi:hypothetical protein